jgi:hypothetical protein
MAHDTEDRPDGSRLVTLYIPFEGVTSISLGPIMFDLTLRWQEGEFANSFALLCAVINVDETVVRKIRAPDVERVLEQFMSMIPAQIRNDIMQGTVPARKIIPEPILTGDEPLAPVPPPLPVSPTSSPPQEEDGLGFDALDEK